MLNARAMNLRAPSPREVTEAIRAAESKAKGQGKKRVEEVRTEALRLLEVMGASADASGEELDKRLLSH